jgi:hypothetical protein
VYTNTSSRKTVSSQNIWEKTWPRQEKICAFLDRLKQKAISLIFAWIFNPVLIEMVPHSNIANNWYELKPGWSWRGILRFPISVLDEREFHVFACKEGWAFSDSLFQKLSSRPAQIIQSVLGNFSLIHI